MADFKFNFSFEDSDEERDVSPPGSRLEVSSESSIVRGAKEILIESNVSAYVSSEVEEIHISGGNFVIKHVSDSNVEENLKDKQDVSGHDILTAAEKSTDRKSVV